MLQSPITPEQLAALPPEIRALVRVIIEHYEQQLAELRAELAGARKTPQNSSLPPSSQHPHAKPAAAKPRSNKKPGGQPGHPKHERALIPTEQCADVVVRKPDLCRRCGGKLVGNGSAPLRHQVWELPEIKPLVTEYQLHRLSCPGCDVTTCGQLPPGVPASQAGPRLVALTALFMGCFRQSKRRVALFLEQVLGQPCSPGWVVKLQKQATAALDTPYDQITKQLPTEDQLGIDETPTKEGSDKAWLWGFVATTFTVFAIRTTRAATILGDLLTERFSGVVNCDRAKMYWCLGKLQWCWAHLKRDFQSLVDSGASGAKYLGHRLLANVKRLFDHWANYRDGTISRATLIRRIGPVRHAIERLLLRGAESGQRAYRGMCRELYDHRDRLWMFLRVEGVEPTNNASERALRHPVIWRKLSFGTQSAAGSRFVETILTIVETCRQQSRSVFQYLAHAIQSYFTAHPTPSLLPRP
jgi:transposase